MNKGRKSSIPYHHTVKGVIDMAKKGFGKLVALAAVAGAAAAGISYVLRYKTFHKELEKDFHEFEDDGAEEEEEGAPSGKAEQPDRNYIALHASKDEFKMAAKDMAEATRNVLKDASVILTDTAHDAVSAAVDTAHIAISAIKNKKAEMEEARRDEEVSEESEFLDDDYVDEDDLYDYAQTEGETIDLSEEPIGSAKTDQEPQEVSPKETATIEEDPN